MGAEETGVENDAVGEGMLAVESTFCGCSMVERSAEAVAELVAPMSSLCCFNGYRLQGSKTMSTTMCICDAYIYWNKYKAVMFT